ncbi:MAG: A24 family peptidase [Lachnospiraceae bacterium]|nr:A24 family peptidase [Robinsoniella sp.]MDY3766307.1 A24 family peptidase [Lachnospiraceae bacterium]
MQNILLVLMSFGAVLTDLREKKIKNIWVIFWTIVGAATRIYHDGMMGAWSSIWGILIPILLLWGGFCMRQIGAGDIKLFSALGSFLGIQDILECMMFALSFGLIFAIANRIMGKKKKTIRLSVPIFFSVLCRIGGLY